MMGCVLFVKFKLKFSTSLRVFVVRVITHLIQELFVYPYPYQKRKKQNLKCQPKFIEIT